MTSRHDANERAKLIDDQGEKLGTLYNTIKGVKKVAVDLNQEIVSQVPIVDKMGNKVEKMDNSLEQKNKQLDVIIETENGWCGMWSYYGVVIVQIFIILIIVASWF